MADQSVLSAEGRAKEIPRRHPDLWGVQSDDWDDPAWQAYVKAYQDFFPENERFPSPSLFAT